jgi:hypothetical protein
MLTFQLRAASFSETRNPRYQSEFIMSYPLGLAINYTLADLACTLGDTTTTQALPFLSVIEALIPGGFDSSDFPSPCNVECMVVL